MGLRGDAGGEARGDVNGDVIAGDFGGGASCFSSFFCGFGDGAEVPEEMFSNFAARTLVLGDFVVDFGGGLASVEFSRAICSNFCASSLAEGVLIVGGAVCVSSTLASLDLSTVAVSQTPKDARYDLNARSL